MGISGKIPQLMFYFSLSIFPFENTQFQVLTSNCKLVKRDEKKVK